jgi:hypothetical protein
MLSEINLATQGTNFFGTRFLGRGLREKLEALLSEDEGKREVCIDFANLGVTQSFLDEFLGVLVVSKGSDLVDRVAFAGCTSETRALLEFVIGSRLRDRDRLTSKTRVHGYQMQRNIISS